MSDRGLAEVGPGSPVLEEKPFSEQVDFEKPVELKAIAYNQISPCKTGG